MRRIGTRTCPGMILVLLLFSPGCSGSQDPVSDPVPAGDTGTWYAGDLHCHSTHSDGDSPVAEVIAAAERQGLDFFVITDHDGNMRGMPTHWHDPDYRSDRMILLYGVEWTTGLGHANVWHTEPFDYTDLWAANRARDARAAIDAAHAQGALFSINHPTAYLCCPWEYEDDEGYDAVEVWNALYRLPNLNELATGVFWDQRLLAGRRVPGVGGSDTHELLGLQSWFLRLGEPTTWVHAEEATAEALLAGIRAGRVSISHEPGAARIEFAADTNGDGVHDVMMGDNVVLHEPRQVDFEVRVLQPGSVPASLATAREETRRLSRGVEGPEPVPPVERLSILEEDEEYVLVILKNGSVHGQWPLDGEPGLLAFSDIVDADARVYYRVELLGKPPADPINSLLRGRMQALSNPIYFGFPE